MPTPVTLTSNDETITMTLIVPYSYFLISVLLYTAITSYSAVTVTIVDGVEIVIKTFDFCYCRININARYGIVNLLL